MRALWLAGGVQPPKDPQMWHDKDTVVLSRHGGGPEVTSIVMFDLSPARSYDEDGPAKSEFEC